MAHTPENSMEISVTGKQWMWNIQHQTGKREKNELHVPVRRNIKLRMTSEDVIHSFSIPSFRVKHDVVPGRYSEMWFNAKEPGQYYLFCAEYCGAQHSGMVGRVVAMEPKDYEAWLANSVVDEPPQIAGEKLFTYYGCVTCHGQQGPSLAHIYGNKRRVIRDHNIYEVTADDNYLRRSILNPNYEFVEGYNQLMPTFQGVLTEDQVNQLIAYLKSLSDPNSSRPEYRPPDALPPAAGTFVPDRNVASGPRSSVLEPTDGVAPPGAVFPSSQPGPTTAPAK
jgi:cytochrome c oxidase subunit 2